MQPVLTQVPPKSLRSIMATFLPAVVRRPARGGPAWPAPMMMASNSGMGVGPPLVCCRMQIWLARERDDEEAAGYCDGVFDEGRGEIVADGFGEESAAFGSCVGSGDCADGSGEEAEKKSAVGEAEGCAGESAHDDAGDELRGDRRLGVVGRLSLKISPRARRLRIQGVKVKPRKASGVSARLIQPRRAAQLTTVGAVRARSPAMIPMRKARTTMGIVAPWDA